MKPFSPFLRFVFRRHRSMLLVTGVILILQFTVFKILYPHAIITYDSFFYIDAAARNLSINYWPIGYSRILRLLHEPVHSDWMVVLVQYLFLEGAVLFFYFTVLYFLHPGKWISRAIGILISVNPILLIISNYILSDSIFTALTILWFTLMLWFIFRQHTLLMYLSIVILFLLYTIRYYAIFYPVFTLVIILLSGVSWKAKMASVGLGCILFISFIYYTAGQYSKLLGRREFSPFSGWRAAENALIMYANVEDHSMDTPPVLLQPLHRFVTHQLDSMRVNATQNNARVYYDVMDTTDPLISYMQWQYRNDSLTDYFSKWASMGDLYHRYAAFLIKRHPLPFVQYYIGKGIQWYMLPTLEISNEFESGNYWVRPQIKEWFGYPSNELTCTTTTVFSTKPYLYLMIIFNLLMLLSSIGFFLLGGYVKAGAETRKAVLLASAFWWVNFIFNIVATPAMLRYGIPILLLNITFGLIQAEWIWRADQQRIPANKL